MTFKIIVHFIECQNELFASVLNIDVCMSMHMSYSIIRIQVMSVVIYNVFIRTYIARVCPYHLWLYWCYRRSKWRKVRGVCWVWCRHYMLTSGNLKKCKAIMCLNACTAEAALYVCTYARTRTYVHIFIYYTL